MTDGDCKPTSVSRRIEAPAEKLFGLLADPARHPDIDGSGMLREGASNPVISGVGGVFAMKMHNDEMGDYEMSNHVVEYELNRRIGWEPVLSSASRTEDADRIGSRLGVRWAFELVPVDATATVVTEIYDCCSAPEWLRTATDNGNAWMESMTTTLERLEKKCAEQ
jgi:hypothetical protein